MNINLLTRSIRSGFEDVTTTSQRLWPRTTTFLPSLPIISSPTYEMAVARLLTLTVWIN